MSDKNKCPFHVCGVSLKKEKKTGQNGAKKKRPSQQKVCLAKRWSGAQGTKEGGEKRKLTYRRLGVYYLLQEDKDL